MTRFIMPIILIGISIAVFFTFTNPIYNSTDPLFPGVAMLNAKVDSYNQALNNSLSIEKQRDELTSQYNAFSVDDLAKVQKLLPDNVDNIRLILEIEQIALPYGMSLKDVKYNTTADKNASSSAGSIKVGGAVKPETNQDYGSWDLEFSTIGTYSNFLNFTKDLENNLRIVDISSIQFSSDTVGASRLFPSSPSPESYKYNFKIKTYWLKN